MKNEYSKIFLDTAPIIYFVEQKEQYLNHIKSIFKANYRSELYTSAISVAEYSLYPYLYDKIIINKIQSISRYYGNKSNRNK